MMAAPLSGPTSGGTQPHDRGNERDPLALADGTLSALRKKSTAGLRFPPYRSPASFESDVHACSGVPVVPATLINACDAGRERPQDQRPEGTRQRLKMKGRRRGNASPQTLRPMDRPA